MPGLPSPWGPGSPLSPLGPGTTTPSPTTVPAEEQLVQASPWENTANVNHGPGTFQDNQTSQRKGKKGLRKKTWLLLFHCRPSTTDAVNVSVKPVRCKIRNGKVDLTPQVGFSVPSLPLNQLVHPDQALRAVLGLREHHHLPDLHDLLVHPGNIAT